MRPESYDFSGWATVNDLRCSDGRVIKRDAFKHNDGDEVSLVWNHQHDGPGNVIGHAMLENRENGVYAYCTLNDTDAGKTAKELVKHGDIRALSIYANQLKQNGAEVIHGCIREVSLVIAGANPGAFIDSVLVHGDASEEEAIIYTGEDIIAHSDNEDELSDEGKEQKNMQNEEMLQHADSDEKSDESEETVQDVFDTLSEKQKTVVYALIGQALEDAKGEDKEDDSEGGNENMKHNVFDNDEQNEAVLSHAAEGEILGDAKRFGSLKDSVMAHADAYGITDINFLFPDNKNVTNEPQFVKRNPDAWVGAVMSGVHHTPFSRIKMQFADITEDAARAKGYIKGNLKKEEVFSLIKRTVDPTTIYKKQKLDRDDILDITDFNVVSWLKGEMRTMLDEEIARAILFGDGRTSVDNDKIDETKIIPVVSDTTSDFYAMAKTVTLATGETLPHAIVRTVVESFDDYEGSGNTTAFLKASVVTQQLLMEDSQGRRMYNNINDLANAMGVSKIVKVPAAVVPSGFYGVILDLNDYNIGCDKGGEVGMFDDFDIDYNQQKYLMETRCSGALTKHHSAIVLKEAASSVG